MKRLMLLLCVFWGLQSCALPPTLTSQVEIDATVNFKESWSSCFHLYTRSEDRNFLLGVHVPTDAPQQASAKLIDLSNFDNIEYAVTLWQGNDMAEEANKQVVVEAEIGRIEATITTRQPGWRRFVSVQLEDLRFPEPYDHIQIAKANFIEFPVSEFCGG